MLYDIVMNRCGAGGEVVHNTINILGTDYKVEIHSFQQDTFLKDKNYAGYCSADEKLIVIADFDNEEDFCFFSEKEKDSYEKRTLRHEIIHAFLNESGLIDNALYEGSWAANEEMVDWIALQMPKICKVCEEAGALWD